MSMDEGGEHKAGGADDGFPDVATDEMIDELAAGYGRSIPDHSCVLCCIPLPGLCALPCRAVVVVRVVCSVSLTVLPFDRRQAGFCFGSRQGRCCD